MMICGWINDQIALELGKVNSITLDSCKKTSLVFDSVVSAVEFINCQSVQMQVLTKVILTSIHLHSTLINFS